MAHQLGPSEAHQGIDEQSIRVAAYRGGLLVALLAVVISIVLAPFAVTSLLGAFRQPVGDRAYNLMASKLHGEWTKLNVAAISINESTQVVTFRVSGFHNCPTRCSDVERVQFFSVRADPNGSVGAPPFAAVDLPPDSSEIDQQFTLPMSGDLLDYPFDRYNILLGTTFSHVTKAGAAVAFSPSATRAGLDFSVDSDIPRITMAVPKLLHAGQYDTAGVTYDSVAALNLYRPAYLRILTVLLTLLIVLAAAYGVLFRPFTQIVPTVGASVLGVWGVRSLLVGTYPPDSTGVDLVLESAILLLLLTIAVRAVFYMWPKSGLGRSRGTRDLPVDGQSA